MGAGLGKVALPDSAQPFTDAFTCCQDLDWPIRREFAAALNERSNANFAFRIDHDQTSSEEKIDPGVKPPPRAPLGATLVRHG
jgi:hypothetical protein